MDEAKALGPQIGSSRSRRASRRARRSVDVYDPDAENGDDDETVQDGTIYERPDPRKTKPDGIGLNLPEVPDIPNRETSSSRRPATRGRRSEREPAAALTPRELQLKKLLEENDPQKLVDDIDAFLSEHHENFEPEEYVQNTLVARAEQFLKPLDDDLKPKFEDREQAEARFLDFTRMLARTLADAKEYADEQRVAGYANWKSDYTYALNELQTAINMTRRKPKILNKGGAGRDALEDLEALLHHELNAVEGMKFDSLEDEVRSLPESVLNRVIQKIAGRNRQFEELDPESFEIPSELLDSDGHISVGLPLSPKANEDRLIDETMNGFTIPKRVRVTPSVNIKDRTIRERTYERLAEQLQDLVELSDNPEMRDRQLDELWETIHDFSPLLKDGKRADAVKERFAETYTNVMSAMLDARVMELSDIPDDFLAIAVLNSQRFKETRAGGQGINDISFWEDTYTDKIYAIKFLKYAEETIDGTTISRGQLYGAIGQTFSELLAIHVAERLGMATNPMRVAGPTSLDSTAPRVIRGLNSEHAIEIDKLTPLMFELAQTSLDMDLIQDFVAADDVSAYPTSPLVIEAIDDAAFTLLDVILDQNTDRHKGNYFYGQRFDGSYVPYPIDHGLSLNGPSPQNEVPQVFARLSTIIEMQRNTNGRRPINPPMSLGDKQEEKRQRAKLRGQIVQLQARLRTLEESLPIDSVISHLASLTRQDKFRPTIDDPRVQPDIPILPGGAETMRERIDQIVNMSPDVLIDLIYRQYNREYMGGNQLSDT